MSDAPKKRPFFQYHLSTTIVLMFVASGLLAANVVPNVFYELQHYYNISGQEATYYGFPWCVYSTSGLSYDPCSYSLYWFAILRNVLVALGVLAFTSIACEWLIA